MLEGVTQFCLFIAVSVLDNEQLVQSIPLFCDSNVLEQKYWFD